VANFKFTFMSISSRKLNTADFFPSLTESAAFQKLLREIRRDAPFVSLSGVTSNAAKSFILSALQAETGKTFIIVCEKNADFENWECDLNFFQSAIQTHQALIETLPSFENDVYSGVSPHAETLEKRALTLWKLRETKPAFLLITARSLLTRTAKPNEIKDLGANLKRDADFPPEDLIESLTASGYVREEPVKSIGEFSVRGGVIDVWSPNNEFPVRVEFFGDTVDSIREFDAETQLSIQQMKEVSLAPMREFAANSKDFTDWSFFARERFAEERFARALKDRTQFTDEGEDFPGWENLFALVKPRNASVFDYLKDFLLVIDEPANIEKTLQTLYETLENRFRETDAANELGLLPAELFLTVEDLREHLQTKQRLEFRALGRTATQTDEDFQIT
jgi:transcription-repair coupling factor (superfamily II helicase)